MIHRGKYPLYDIDVRIADLELNEDILKHKGSLGIEEIFDSNWNKQIGGLGVNQAILFGRIQSKNAQERRYNIFFSGRNGFWHELLRMKNVNGVWKVALRILNEEDRKIRWEFSDEDFPGKNSIDWN